MIERMVLENHSGMQGESFIDSELDMKWEGVAVEEVVEFWVGNYVLEIFLQILGWYQQLMG